MRNAVLSVADKEGLVEFAQALVELEFTLYTSKGTGEYLAANAITSKPIAELVGGGPILGHRVVTLAREIYAGLLSRDIKEDVEELLRLNIPHLHLVCVDFYSLPKEVARPGSTRESVIEKTDIGGPTLIRAAAKGGRIAICDVADRARVIEWLRAGEPENGLVQELAAKGEFIVSRYCLTSAEYLSGGLYSGFLGERVRECRYGENAWQSPAALFSTGTGDPLAMDRFEVVGGVDPSFNNWCDIDRLLQTATHIAAVYPTSFIAVGGKHGNACGAAVGHDRREILEKMMAGDPRAIFGGLVMVNFRVDEALCESLAGKMLDGIIAPAFTPGAIAALRRKGDKCRFVVNPALGELLGRLDQTPRLRFVRGGFLKQPNYTFVPDFDGGEIVEYGTARIGQVCDMKLAWAIGSTSNSNTVTLVKSWQLIGNAVGQQDRVGGAELAVTRARRAGHDITGATAYSDSFFPFPDGPKVLIDAGVSAIFTSSGSVKDQETIDLCKERGVALYMIPDAVGRGFFGH